MEEERCNRKAVSSNKNVIVSLLSDDHLDTIEMKGQLTTITDCNHFPASSKILYNGLTLFCQPNIVTVNPFQI